MPPTLDDEVTFISGVNANGTLAYYSFASWNEGTNPADYSGGYTLASKWYADAASGTAGTAGGPVYYYFDPASSWSATEQQELRAGLALWAAVANISFVQIYDAAAAKLTFTRGNDGGAYTSGTYATYPGSGVTGGTQLYQITSSTISIDTHVAGFGPITTSFSSYGGYPLLTLLHEEGHAIGLGHAGPYNGDVDEMTQQYSPYDTRLWSAMSYIDAQDTATAYYGQYPVTSNWGTSPDHYYRVPTTWMPLDILAAQRLYGLPTTTPLSGGQIFGFHTNIAGDIRPYFDFTQNMVPIVTLWDMGGNNTLDLSGFSAPSTVNLTPGTYSSAAGLTANIAIAFGTMIDTFIGGSGNDTVWGNGDVNYLFGGLGNDTLYGTGNDYLYGEAGNDTLVAGGAGDFAVYSGASIGVTIDLTVTGGQTTGDGFDTLTGIRNVIGSDYNDNLRGNTADNILFGGLGNDTIDIADLGNDTVHGDAGDDIIRAGAFLNAADVIDGGAGQDLLILLGNYTYTFVPGNLTGIESIRLDGGASYDLTMTDADLPAGGVLEIVSNQGSADHLRFNGAAETDGYFILRGGPGDDDLTSGAGNDYIYIDRPAGTDIVHAGGGDDQIVAGNALIAADVIDGGQGSDTLTISGSYNLTFNATTLTNVERLVFGAGTYNLTTVDANVAAGQTLTVDAANSNGSAVRFDGHAESNGTFNFIGGTGGETFIGGAGNDSFSGNDGNDTLDISAGGNDTVDGGIGDDTILAGAALTAADHIDGGTGSDTVSLDGEYAGLVLAPATLQNIEKLVLHAGHDYALTPSNATVAASQTLTVDGSALGSGDTLAFDGAAENNGYFIMTGGAGADTLTGGSLTDQLNGGGGNDTLDITKGGNDIVHGGDGDDLIVSGSQLTAADVIDGGAGTDTLSFAARGITFGATTIQNVEKLQLLAGGNYTLIFNNANVAANQRLTVEGAALGATNILTFNGSAETDGFFTVNGGAGNDSLIGGKLADILNGGGGNDTINLAYGGDDTVNAGAGDDTILALAQMTAADNIDGGDGFDTLSFAGRGMTFTATTVRNIEKLVLTSGNYALITNDATVAASARLVIDATALTHASTVSVNGMAELDGAFTFLGGAGKERYLGGQGDDLFQMGAGFSLDDTLDGRGGSNTLSLDGDYHANMTLGASTLLNIQTIDLAAGHSYNFTTNTATVAGNANLTVNGALLGAGDSLTLNGAAETNGSFTLTGGAGGDTLIGGNRADILTGGGGKDMLNGGAGADIYRYNAVSDSTGTNYDVISGFDFGGVAHDLFDLTGTIVGVGTAVNAGTLSAASFNSDLTAAISAARLSAQYAVLFTPNAGDLAGHTFLIADANGNAGYQAAGDYVFDLAAPVRTNYFAVSDFG